MTVDGGAGDREEFPRPGSSNDDRQWERIDVSRGSSSSMGADTSIFRSQFCLFEEAGGGSPWHAGNDVRRRGGGLLEKDMGGRETVARQNDLRGGCKNVEEHQDRVGERCGG